MSELTLQQWRKDREITLAELARQVGMSLYKLHRIEKKKVKRLTLRDALAIERATGGEVPPRSLVDMT